MHLTADRHLVVIHDDRVDRTTDGSGLVREMTLREIKRLDAGYKFPGQGGKTYPYRGQGVVVPTLEEVYQIFPDVPMNVEIKEDQPGIEQTLCQVIEEADAAERTLVVSGKMSIIRRFRFRISLARSRAICKEAEPSLEHFSNTALLQLVGFFFFWLTS